MQSRLFVILAGPLMLGGCLYSCGNDVVRVAASPDGMNDAIVFQRDCGATTGFSTQISILSHGRRPSTYGNAFIADDNHGQATAARWGGPWADVMWLSARHLLITYDANAAVGTKNETVAGIRISYRTVAVSEPRFPR
jgi:hypothetical protein